MDDYYDDDYSRYVSAAERKGQAAKQLENMRRKGEEPEPVTVTARNIAKTFWGQAWNRHIESFQDYASRLPRGRSYLRQGAVVDLKIGEGEIRAQVLGSELYQVHIRIDKLEPERWTAIRKACAGRISSLIDLLQGKLSPEIIAVLCEPDTGLFPASDEIKLICDCPDWADLCKHLAAVLYGVGARLDEKPELFFLLRGVDRRELLEADWSENVQGETTLDSEDLGGMFGIELDQL
jgi:uncharacterized Zn finger protein